MAIKAVELAGPSPEMKATLKKLAEEQYEVLRAKVKKLNSTINITPGKYLSTKNAVAGKTDYRLDVDRFQGLLQEIGYRGPKNSAPGIVREAMAFTELKDGYRVTVVFDPRSKVVMVRVAPPM
jgi:hypothetical protein